MFSLYLCTEVKPLICFIMAKKGQLTTADPLIGGEYERFVNRLRADNEYVWELYARLSFCTACRSSDVRNFRWKDVLGKAAVITEQKTKKVRQIPFSHQTRDKIKELYVLLGEPNVNEFIFKSPQGNKPITIQRVNQVLKEMKRRYRLKVDNFSTHSFRKTFGRYVYDKPGDKSDNLVKLNLILKHSSLEVTKRYIGITKEEINNVFESLDI